MNVYRNTKFTKRDYECSNVVACEAESAPGPQWELSDVSAVRGLGHLWTVAGVRYWGWL